ncbi:GNAT family N-acetyltransferase [Streptomyces roseoverticillatus]|uniref:GNAT family N-acetyltransferase n=1 Tax=Streptomyces roseoverticillatus TaxID=66429 RepID=UPI001F236028|nr:GNAT family N-acetyltransferase [Streptomyces roseoverticillatus]MCF3102122.1 GNAT family N-acetyltransferase [Streptomyces roseoverticillatus]
MNATFKPLDTSDARDLAALRAEVERADRSGAHEDETDALHALTDPKLDLAHNTVGAWQGSRLVAYAMLYEPEGVQDVARFDTAAAVHPDLRRRGIGTRLVDWMRRRAEAIRTERHPGIPAELLIDGTSTNAGLAALAEHTGFEPCRYWFTMAHDLHPDRLPTADVPAGLRLVPFATALDEATRGAHNDAFRDHWNHTETDTTDWNTWFTGHHSFRAGLSALLLTPDDRVAAYLLADEYVADGAATGRRTCTIDHLGTRPAHRGRGAARALLAHTLAEAGRRGYDKAELVVDAANPTGALKLYERMGFATEREFVTYARPLG